METNKTNPINGLELIKLKSSAKPVDVTAHLKSVIQGCFVEEKNSLPTFVIAYLDYKVLIGKWNDNGFHFYKNETFEDKYVQKLRVFNKDKELFLWRTKKDGKTCLKGRLRTDNDENGNETNIVAAKQVLFGTKGELYNDDFTEIKEERGTNLILPFKINRIDNDKQRVFIKTHNYVGYNAVNQANYVDCRFVSFIYDKNNELQ